MKQVFLDTSYAVALSLASDEAKRSQIEEEISEWEAEQVWGKP